MQHSLYLPFHQDRVRGSAGIHSVLCERKRRSERPTWPPLRGSSPGRKKKENTRSEETKRLENEQNILFFFLLERFWQTPHTVSYLSSWRHRATAVGSAAAVHHPVARLEQAQAQGAPQVAGPEDTQRLWKWGSFCARGTQGHILRPHLSLFFHVDRLS